MSHDKLNIFFFFFFFFFLILLADFNCVENSVYGWSLPKARCHSNLYKGYAWLFFLLLIVTCSAGEERGHFFTTKWEVFSVTTASDAASWHDCLYWLANGTNVILLVIYQAKNNYSIYNDPKG